MESKESTNDEATGVLILERNQTYAVANNTSKGVYYRIIPRNSPNTPVLVKYKEDKKGAPTPFIKVKTNLYVCYRIQMSSTSSITAPLIATLTNVIGEVNSIDAFQKYEMISRGIYNTISPFANYINKHHLFKGTHVQHITFPYKKRRFYQKSIITIDPLGAKDLDDAFTINTCFPDSTITVSVYIALVSAWVERFDAGSYICNPDNFRASTIYLAEGETRPIFPPLLTKHISLLADEKEHPVMAYDYIYDMDTLQLKTTRIEPACIIIGTNYTYDSTL